jgi:hypothetical protein
MGSFALLHLILGKLSRMHAGTVALSTGVRGVCARRAWLAWENMQRECAALLRCGATALPLRARARRRVEGPRPAAGASGPACRSGRPRCRGACVCPARCACVRMCGCACARVWSAPRECARARRRCLPWVGLVCRLGAVACRRRVRPCCSRSRCCCVYACPASGGGRLLVLCALAPCHSLPLPAIPCHSLSLPVTPRHPLPLPAIPCHSQPPSPAPAPVPAHAEPLNTTRTAHLGTAGCRSAAAGSLVRDVISLRRWCWPSLARPSALTRPPPLIPIARSLAPPPPPLAHSHRSLARSRASSRARSPPPPPPSLSRSLARHHPALACPLPSCVDASPPIARSLARALPSRARTLPALREDRVRCLEGTCTALVMR